MRARNNRDSDYRNYRNTGIPEAKKWRCESHSWNIPCDRKTKLRKSVDQRAMRDVIIVL